MKRINLKKGKLYWCKRNDDYPQDKLDVVECDPLSGIDFNRIIDMIYMNDQNIFCFIEAIQHHEDDSLWWYKVITSRGNIGYFILGDEEFSYLGIEFVRVKN
jgi:hypothetical protein